MQIRAQIAIVSPGQCFEPEIKDTVQLVEGNAHVEAGFGGGQAGATGVLHDRKAVDVEPACGVWVNGSDGGNLEAELCHFLISECPSAKEKPQAPL